MRFRAAVFPRPELGAAEVRIVRIDGERMAAMTIDDRGHALYTDVDPHAVFPPTLVMDHEAAVALRDALNDHAPPRDDTDLRDALDIERERVDRILGSIVAQW